MANKGAAAAGGGIVTVIVAGTLAFFGGRSAVDNNAADNNAPDNAAVVENAPDNTGNGGTDPVTDPTPPPKSIDELIAEFNEMSEALGQDPPKMPEQQQLLRVFEASPERVAKLQTTDILFYRSQLWVVQGVMDREGYPHDRAGRYDTSDREHLSLVKSADGGFRISLK